MVQSKLNYLKLKPTPKKFVYFYIQSSNTNLLSINIYENIKAHTERKYTMIKKKQK